MPELCHGGTGRLRKTMIAENGITHLVAITGSDSHGDKAKRCDCQYGTNRFFNLLEIGRLSRELYIPIMLC